MVYNQYKFYNHSSVYVLEPVITNSNLEKPPVSEILVFHRDAGSVELSDHLPPLNNLNSNDVSLVYGLMGIIRLLSGDYLILITGRELVGNLGGSDIYQITSTQLYPFARNRLYLTINQASDEERYLSYLQDVTNVKNYYFSYDYHLTLNLQKQYDSQVELGKDLIEKANTEFQWNSHIIKPFLEVTEADSTQNFSNFLLPIIHGFIAIKPLKCKNKNLTYALISRRSWHRTGTRFFSRGIDTNGNVSNFAETEQIVLGENPNDRPIKLSYTQIRGSIPFKWSQVTNLKYTPKLEIIRGDEAIYNSMKTHFNKLIEKYGDVYIVNLINKKGYELPMGNELAVQLDRMNNSQVHYYHFDFHKECSKMRWDRIDLLVQHLDEHLKQYGYYFEEDHKDSQTTQIQTGVIRTNCMDCLDRTNVVQSVLAKHILLRQLKDVGYLQENEGVEQLNSFEEDFRNVWADNADAVSLHYSGTGALKTDFTRTGKRTKQGAIQDGINSVIRYFKNNFLDGARQDSLDLFLGKYEVSQNAPTPFRYSFTWRFHLVAGLSFSSLVLALVQQFFQVVEPKYNWLVNLVVFGVLGFCLKFAMSNGQDFVDRPRLILYEFDNIKSPSVQVSEKSSFLSGSTSPIVTEKDVGKNH